VADKIVHNSNLPVRLVKSYPRGQIQVNEQPDRKILALVDGSEMSEQVLPYAAYHSSLSEGELLLFHVCEPPDTIPGVVYHLIPQSYPPELPVRWEDHIRDETEKRKHDCQLYLARLQERLAGPNIRVYYDYRLGEAPETIIRYLEDNPVDMVAMTTRGRSGLRRWVLGSVAEKVILATDSPVLIIRPG
jgi:nucleotide-binding universal stress UspA family protein